jgi:predicted Zn finger-like uncharacterized protein
MKIVCDSCSAKYSIADEKVAGRVFKIRCKKCGAAIVVRGEAGAGGSQEAAAPGGGGFDYGGEAVWHVVVDGEQQGPFSPQQLGGMISANTIAWDTYVWREGFDDWKPAQDIEDLVQAIMNPGGGGAAAAEDPFSDQPTTMAASASPAAKSSPPAAAKAAKRDAGADLFAQSEASPFGGGGGGGEDDDVVASAPSPRVSGNQAMTGQRNENSVLFSLSNLQALATGAPGGGPSPSPSAKPAAAAPKAGMAQGEGSGLIDIRALASATGLTGGGGPAPSLGGGGSPPKVDDLLSIGAPNVGLGSALAAPVIIAEKPEPKSGGGNGMIIAAAILGVCVLGGAGVVAYVSMNQPDPAATAPAVGAIAPGTAAAPPPSAAAVPTPPPSAAAVPTPPPSAAVAAPPPSEAPATGGGSTGSSGSRSGGSRRGSSGGSTGSSASPSAPAADPAPAPSGSRTSSSSGSSGGDRSIDALLEGALGGGGARRGSSGSSSAAPSAPAGDASLPATPGRSDVVTAMSGVQGAVTACGTGEHGVASVQISVTGSTGRVANATVGGQFAGTPVGSCIARAVRGATFPHFRNPTFSFTYPFRI